MRTFHLKSITDDHCKFMRRLLADFATKSGGSMKGEPGCVKELLNGDNLPKNDRECFESIVTDACNEIGRMMRLDLKVVRHALLLYTKNGRHHMHSDYPDVLNNFSASINLSHDCTGGRLKFYRPQTRVTTKKQWRWHLQSHMRKAYPVYTVGSSNQYDANVFDARLLHEVERVDDGERLVLTLWMICETA